MTQMNMDSGTSRKIRRIDATGIGSGVGDGDSDDADAYLVFGDASFPGLSAPELPTAATSTAALAALIWSGAGDAAAADLDDDDDDPSSGGAAFGPISTAPIWSGVGEDDPNDDDDDDDNDDDDLGFGGAPFLPIPATACPRATAAAAAPIFATSKFPRKPHKPRPPRTKPKPSKPPKAKAAKSAEVKAQTALGAQSKRGVTNIDYGPVVSRDAHGRHCFDRMLENEARLCGEWAVFYHSYSMAALLYEVQTAVAAVLFRFKSTFAVLPRLLMKGFATYPDAPALLAAFPTMNGRDHDPRYRQVGVCATSALLANDAEAPAKSVFLMGYSANPVDGVLESLLAACGFPQHRIATLAREIVALSENHGLDVRGFRGSGCKSGRPGHLLQIFMKRALVDKYVYASRPYGVPDPPRQPLGKFLAGPGPIHGQVRICAHPAVFMRAACVRMYVYSADPSFHSMRQAFQEKLTKLLDPI
eukprot:EG_transcript_6249